MNKINLTDSTMDVVVKMSNGNPGAVDVIMKLLTQSNNIDPDDIMGGLGKILLLDTYGIYGTDIYVLYNDICERNLPKMVAVICATQMGIFSSHILKDACSRQDYSGRKLIPVDELCEKIKERLSLFNFDFKQSEHRLSLLTSTQNPKLSKHI